MTDRLREIIDEFQGVPDEFRLEMLLERARQFPPLPERYQALREKGLGRVHECMAEVYFFPEVQDGAVRIHADIPGDAPTQRALVGILMDAYDGASPEAVAQIPHDLLNRLGVAKMLGMQRQRGFSGVVAQLQRGVAEAAR
ncbi:MAG TPA: SufE family protein [Bacteroidetes bacterium]|nr:SufE family protein [Bacteroidota bacterium]HIL58933.1 SufE family protein [Rhodothermales bacterium]